MPPDHASVVADLIRIASDVAPEMDYDTEMTAATRPYEDLSWQSVDFAVLAEGIESLYKKQFPFTEFFTEMFRRDGPGVSLDEIAAFILANLGSPEAALRRDLPVTGL